MSTPLGNSTREQARLRPIALWAAACVERALPVFEARHPQDPRPRQAIDAGRAFGAGKRRDQQLRTMALAAMKAGKDRDEPSKYLARAATLVASVAYTHTDLQTGQQGIRQARHLLGPAVYAALALESAGHDPHVGIAEIHLALQSAPPELAQILPHFPPQPPGKTRADHLFHLLDTNLRNSQRKNGVAEV